MSLLTQNHRELLAPLEQVIRQLLAAVLLVGVGRLVYENWDFIFSSYQVLSGAEPVALPALPGLPWLPK